MAMTTHTPNISALVPYAHVANVEASAAFYAKLGFVLEHEHRDAHGHMVWAFVACGHAKLMLAQSSGAIDASQQAVLFYVHCHALAALRASLLHQGVLDGGTFTGGVSDQHLTNTVFAITKPFYMPLGEMRVHDLDGYVLLIGQEDSSEA